MESDEETEQKKPGELSKNQKKPGELSENHKKENEIDKNGEKTSNNVASESTAQTDKLNSDRLVEKGVSEASHKQTVTGTMETDELTDKVENQRTKSISTEALDERIKETDEKDSSVISKEQEKSELCLQHY